MSAQIKKTPQGPSVQFRTEIQFLALVGSKVENGVTSDPIGLVTALTSFYTDGL